MIDIPATVELSDFSNGIWSIKSSDLIQEEITKSIQQYGFAVLVTHPQEFMENEGLNQVAMEFYQMLLINLKENYSVKTLQQLSENFAVYG